MTDEIKRAVADALKENSSGQNITPAQLAARRLGQLQPEAPQEEVTEEVSEQVEETEVEEPVAEATEETQAVEEVEEETEETTEETETDDVLSQYNLDEMSEEDIKDLGKQLGSKAVLRFGELTARRKQAEERLAKLEAQLSDQKSNILSAKKPVENNPYSSLETTEALQKKAQELNDIVSWAEDTLFESDGYAADDVVTEVEGKEVTKAQVRQSLLQARKARDTYLPDQLNKIQAKENGKQLKEAFTKQAQDELSWLSGEDNDIRKRYESMLSDKRFVDLQESVEPDIAAQLPYIIAHAANSIYGRKLVKESPKVSITPPKTGATAAPTTSRASKGKKALADLSSRFKNSGTRDDFIKLRTKQLTR
jgi:actin-related protein